MKPKVTHRKARGRKAARTTIRCGCCKEKLEIYLPCHGLSDPDDHILEINGVAATRKEWREALADALHLNRGRSIR